MIRCFILLSSTIIESRYILERKLLVCCAGRHIEEQFDGERARTGERRRCVRGADGRDGNRLRDSGMRVRLEKPEGRHRGTGE